MSNCHCNQQDNSTKRAELLYYINRYKELASLQKSRGEYDSAKAYDEDRKRAEFELSKLK